MDMARMRFNEGWRLLGSLAALLTVMTVAVAAVRSFDVDGVRMAIRYTARTSLLLFLLAYTARPLATLWPTMWSRWQLRNRRYLGLSFAVSHGLHLIAIAAFALMAPALFHEATSPASFVFGGIGYTFIALMAATSFDSTARAIGPRAWRILHVSGITYLWVQFMISFGKRVPDMPLYALFLVPLIAALILRIVAMRRRRTQTVQATAS